MVNIDFLKQIFGDNMMTVSSPEDMDKVFEKLKGFFGEDKTTNEDGKEEKKHNCKDCPIYTTCLALADNVESFREVAAAISASALCRIIRGDDHDGFYLRKFADTDAKVADYADTILDIITEAKKTKECTSDILVKTILDVSILYLWHKTRNK